jgi:hypothetical protein
VTGERPRLRARSAGHGRLAQPSKG